jgi:hypothetical protein
MKIIKLSGKIGNGKEVWVDDEDFDKFNEFKWHQNNGYAVSGRGVRPNRYKVLLHRLIMDAPNDLMVDHKNGNKLDCRKENLRLCTNSQNQMNAKKQIKSSESSKYKGVIKNKPFRAIIGRKTLGYFDTELEAAECYNKAALELYGEFAKLNEL